MNQDNKDVKKALDDIFGSDFIEIDSNNKDDITERDNNYIEPIKEQAKEEMVLDDYIDVSEEKNTIENDYQNYFSSAFEQDDPNVIYNLEENKVDTNETKDNNLPNNEDDKLSSLENKINEITSKEEEDRLAKEALQQAINNKKTTNTGYDNDKANNKSVYSRMSLVAYFVIGILLGILLIFLIVNKNSTTEGKISCTYSAKDKDMEISDEYVITRTGNKLTYIEGEYVYTAKTEEFKPQVELIKEQKLPVVINSNGMSGFTHVYEISDSYFKMSSYYDISLMDFAVIDKNNQKVTPISYITINSKTTYNSLKKELEKNEYKCVNTN